MATIFLSGAIVGGVWGRFVAREEMLSMLRHPEQVPDRILPQIRSSLSLDEDQARQVETIVRRRHAAMEVVRSICYPELLEQFQAMRTDIADVLAPEQRIRWKKLSDTVEQRYLPAPPATSPQEGK